MLTKRIVDKYVVLLLSSSIFIFCSYLTLCHLDYFINKTETKGEVVKFSESAKEDGFIAFIKYDNTYLDSSTEEKILIPYPFYGEYQKKSTKAINVVYTKWFKQFFIKGYKNPRLGIFLFDFVSLMLMWFGIRYGIKGLAKKY